MIKTYWMRILVSGIVLGVVGCVGSVSPSGVAHEATPTLDAIVPESPTAAKPMPGEAVEGATPSTRMPEPSVTPLLETPGRDDIRLTPASLPALERVPATEPAFVTGEVPQGLLVAILDDLVARTGVQRAGIQIVGAEAVVWSDGSLGCPQPGMMYTQALVEGYRVVLEVNGERYDYHASDRGTFTLCEGGVTQVGPPPGLIVEQGEMTPSVRVSPGLQPVVDLALDDLAERLAIEAAQIVVIEVKEVVWPDASLGCPQPGMAYIQVPQDGLLIRLVVEGREYAYHSGGIHDPFLCEPAPTYKDTPPKLDLDDFVTPSPATDL